MLQVLFILRECGSVCMYTRLIAHVDGLRRVISIPSGPSSLRSVNSWVHDFGRGRLLGLYWFQRTDMQETAGCIRRYCVEISPVLPATQAGSDGYLPQIMRASREEIFVYGKTRCPMVDQRNSDSRLHGHSKTTGSSPPRLPSISTSCNLSFGISLLSYQD